jgi:copper transport protein
MQARAVRRIVAAFAVVVTSVIGSAGVADAHAVLESTDPPAGATLQGAPNAVRVTFDEQVGARDGDVRVYDSTGRRIDKGKVEHIDGGKTLQVPIQTVGDGGYAVTWRVISADTHPVDGAVTWRVGASGAAVGTPLLNRLLSSARGSPVVSGLLAAQRGLLFGGLLVLLGGLSFVLLLWPEGATSRRWKRSMAGAAIVAAVASVVGVGLQAANQAGLGVSSVVDGAPIGDVLRGDYGQAVIGRMVLLVVGLWQWRIALGRKTDDAPIPTWARPVALIMGVLLAGSLGFAGHPRTGRWLAAALPIDIVHVVAASIWIGGLVTLVLIALPGLDAVATRRLAARFSPVAFTCVAVLVATGSLQAFRQLGGSWTALRSTDYGHLLIIKVALSAVVVAIGGSSRSLVHSGWIDDTEEETAKSRRLVLRSIASEVAIAVVVVAVTSLLVASDPHALTANTAFSASRVDGPVIVDAVVAPSRHGPVSVHLYASDPNIALTDQFTMTAEIELPGKVASVPLPLIAAGGRHWIADGVEVPIAGKWRLTVRVVVGQLDEHVFVFDVPVR